MLDAKSFKRLVAELPNLTSRLLAGLARRVREGDRKNRRVAGAAAGHGLAWTVTVEPSSMPVPDAGALLPDLALTVRRHRVRLHLDHEVGHEAGGTDRGHRLVGREPEHARAPTPRAAARWPR